MRAAKQEADVFPLAAFRLLAENSHRGHRLPTAVPHKGFAPVNSNTTTGFQAFLYDEGRRSRSTGKERDSETGLDYFGARYFSGAEGRFISADWATKPEAVPYADLSDPQTLNLYGYVRNNPMVKEDADGHCNLSADNETCLGAAQFPPPASPPAPLTAQQQSLSPAGLKFLEQQETVGGVPNLTPYDASGKKHSGDWTIGYGHKIKPGEDFSKGITADQAAGLLSADVQTAVNAVNGALRYPTGSFQNEFDAMVSLAYNIGGGAFASSTLVKRYNSGGVVEQPDLFTRFSRTGGASSPGLYARREREYTLFNTGEY